MQTINEVHKTFRELKMDIAGPIGAHFEDMYEIFKDLNVTIKIATFNAMDIQI